MKIRFAQLADAQEITLLTKAGFTKELLSAMIYGCSGIDDFLKSQISIPLGIADTVYIVAESDGVVVGFVEFRIYVESIFLNYIGISPLIRQQGLASKLLRQAVLLVRNKHHKIMSLDVFSDNIVAKKWYEKLGFTAEFNTGWYKISQAINGDKDVEQAKVSGFTQARLCYKKFGFSQFTITTNSGSYAVGMLGQEWFRVTQIQLLSDAAALSCLNSIDSDRNILGLFRDTDQDKLPKDAVCFCRPIRMNTQLDTFEKNIF